LLAKAVDQSTYVLTETPLSRASPLPHLVRCLQQAAAVEAGDICAELLGE